MIRRVIIGTIAHNGWVTTEYCHSLASSQLASVSTNISLFPVTITGDALIQRARNDLVRIAVESRVDDLVFIDADQGWRPEELFRLLSHPVDFVGAPVVKKSLTEIDYNVVRLPELKVSKNGLVKVKSVGTGMLRLTANALATVWGKSAPYANNGPRCRMVFDVIIENGELLSEDTALCRKWGGDVWVDPTIDPIHIGSYPFRGNFHTLLEP